MPEPPEQKARRDIDAKLTAAGWLVQSRADADLTAGRGIALREFQMRLRRYRSRSSARISWIASSTVMFSNKSRRSDV
jgi:hypothetical protein